MVLFNLAALTVASCLAIRLGSTVIAKHVIESDLVRIASINKKRGRVMLNFIIVLQKNEAMTPELNDILEQAYLHSLQMDTWQEIADADRQITVASDLAIKAMRGKLFPVDKERFENTIEAMSDIDEKLLDLRSEVAAMIENFNAKNSTIVSRIMGLPRYRFSLLLPEAKRPRLKKLPTIIRRAVAA
jgi:hypothetical protein